jgi:hypothetical protein
MKTVFASIVLAFVAFSCANESEPAINEAKFTRIYDNNRFNASYFPIDIVQTPDNGYLVLGGRRLEDTNFTGIYLLKVNSLGEVVKEVEFDSDFVNPIYPILTAGDNFYFFCMTPIGLQTRLAEMDASGQINQMIPVGGTYPAAAAADGSNFVLLSYDNLNKESRVSVVTPAGVISRSRGFSIGPGDDVEEPLINHFLRTGRQLPFLVGRVPGGGYFFNGYYNYTLSLVFTDLNQPVPQGVVQGQQSNGGMNSLLPLGGGRFAASRFNFGDNYFLPNVTLNAGGISSSVDLGGNPMPELASNSTVKVIPLTIDGKTQVAYTSFTRSRQIAILAYDQATGNFLGSKYLGFSNPFEVASMVQTRDGGLAVCGTTYVAGRFPRICIFKLTANEVNEAF